ncbi:phosphoadenosine phosphosulfate reductase family protein [Halonatronum saccharophilum]|uniref:phosphoadenosine phosphosulfate reductase domain-containing protein n=1 Tax=Halonatronum saccharophilum TaxID=150060 RepID=UPI0004AC990F|nr:phosphoadenosine phosphosulfate reductase family protein [Halonatronum saccharophilum]
MQIFWCKECETPVLLQEYKSKSGNYTERAEGNSYLDIEDEVVEWVFDHNGNEGKYNKFMFLKEDIKKMLDNKNSSKKIEEKIESEYKEYPEEIKDYVIRYLNMKLDNQDKKNLKHYRCPKCDSKVNYMSSDLRPVFMEERILLSVLLEEDYTEKNIWNGSGNRYIIDGKSSNIAISDIYKVDNLDEKIEMIKERIEGNNKKVDFTNFIEVNREHFSYIDNNANDFIEKVSKIFDQRMRVVSFSGGKDSTVVSDLVRRSLGTQNILHVFGDTTLEFPFTYEYIERIKEEVNRPPFLPVDKPNQSFNELAEQFGPPSRVMSWCCSIYKTGPIGSLFRDIAKQQKILTFYGVRRSESSSRSKYDKISNSPKISQQLVVSPIVDWHDVDVWLYLLTRGIDFNQAYRLGFTRVGCWCCPNNSDWSEFLCKIFMSNRSEEWRDFLVNFAKKIGKPDAEVYIDTGKWKARQGGQGLNTKDTILEASPCGLGDNAKSYDLNRPIDDSLYEFFKPFGELNKDIGDPLLGEVYILNYKTGAIEFRLQGIKGNKELKVIVDDEAKNIPLLFQRIECQLRKYQSCVECSACINVCPYDAITVKSEYKIDRSKNEFKYQIDEEKCVHCMKCIAHFHRGCLVTKAMIDY